MRRKTLARHIARLVVLGLALSLGTGSLRAEGRAHKALAPEVPSPIATDQIVFQARLGSLVPTGEAGAEPAPIALQLQLFDQSLDGQPLAEPTTVELGAEQGDQIRVELGLDPLAGSGSERWLEASLVDADGRVLPLAPRHALGSEAKMASMEGSGYTLSGMTWRAAKEAETDAMGDPASYGELLNLSTRGYVGTGDAVLIAGFIVDAPTVVMVRALGPSLAASGVPGVLADPEIEIYHEGMPVAYNDDWVDSELAGAIANTFSLAPADPRESVLIHVLDRGAYTAIVRGFDGVTGIGLVEVFQLGRAAAPQAQVTVDNQTGAALCYEVHGSGIGERCFGPGEYTYGLFEAGTYAYTVRGVCGIAREIQDYPQGHWSHSFWCEPAAGPTGEALGQQLDAQDPEAAPTR